MPFKLSVKNFGPIKAANLELTRVNVFVGPQSSGKSTILKIASFCNWLEKQIQLSQNPLEWATPQTVKDNLLTFHRLEGFADVNSEICSNQKRWLSTSASKKKAKLELISNGLKANIGIIQGPRTLIYLQKGT